jgi:hypothetical protein
MSDYDASLTQYEELPLDDPPLAVGNDRENDPKEAEKADEEDASPVS